MPYYHCSPTPGLTVLQPRKPEVFQKPAYVYMTTSLPMALMYGVRNFEYTYGYTKAGQIYLEEYFPNALELLYRGRAASLYLCAPEKTACTRIPNEVVSELPVRIVEEKHIPDVYDALLEQIRLGNLLLRPYACLPAATLEWIRQAEADTIRKHGLRYKTGPMSDYYRTHYPQSWELAAAE